MMANVSPGLDAGFGGAQHAIPYRHGGSRAAHTEQVMSAPQHRGDLILPCPSGHLEIVTFVPSSRDSVSCTSSLLHFPHVMLPTLMPHFSHS